MRDTYRLVSVWRVAGTIAEVKAILADSEALSRWWPSVYLDVHPLQPGGPDLQGAVVAVHTKGWLPYILRWVVRITEPITDEGFAFEASGDLVGTGRCSFVQNGPDVHLTLDWRVTATKPLLRRLRWLGRPLFIANHRWAMARGEKSLNLELRRRRITDEDARRRVPPPPRAALAPLWRLAARCGRPRPVQVAAPGSGDVRPLPAAPPQPPADAKSA